MNTIKNPQKELFEKVFSCCEIILRRKWLLILPILFGLVMITAYSYTITPMYRSSMILVVEEEKVANPYIKGVAISATVRERLATLLQKLTSWTRLKAVIDILDLDRDINEEQEFENLVRNLRKHIKVNMIGRDLLRITCEYSDPIKCQEIVNTMTSLFIQENLQLLDKETNIGIDFLTREIGNYRKKLQTSEEALREFKESNIGVLSQRLSQELSETIGMQTALNINVVRFNEFSGDQINLALNLSEAVEEKKILDDRLKEEPKYIISERISERNPILSVLNEKLVNMKIKLANLLIDSSEQHPSVVRLQREIERTVEIIGSQEQEMTFQETRTINPVHQEIELELSKVNRKIKALEKRMSINKVLMKGYEAKIKEIPEKEAKYAELNRNYAIDSKIYAKLVDKRETAYITKRLEVEEKGTKFKILDPARLPLKPFKPNRGTYVLGGIFLGVLLGIGLVVISEIMEASFKNVEELKSVFTDIPVLGPVAEIVTVQELKIIWEKRKISVLVLALIIGGVFFSILFKVLLSK